MTATVLSATLAGLNAILIEIEAALGGGDFGQIKIVGLPDTSVTEARERVRSAIINSGYKFPKRKITINLAPANLKKNGPGYDLPIAISILSLKYKLSFDTSTSLFIGELSLAGKLRPIKGVTSILTEALKLGIKNIFLPADNIAEASLMNNLQIFLISDLKQLLNHLSGQKLLTPFSKKVAPSSIITPKYLVDFADIKGQKQAKRALEIAISGGHNLSMIGPPGSGKTTLAQAAVSILPPLNESEKIEIAKISSIAEQDTNNLKGLSIKDLARPFRSPHYQASVASLIGGGAKFKIGEFTMAHLGVLFLDELPEFSRSAIESLRQPLEAGIISINRASLNFNLPARFILITASNPCPCGLNGIQGRNCYCSFSKIKKYQNKISTAITDRIDIHLKINNLDYLDLESQEKNETSKIIRSRIIAARKIQLTRSELNNPKLNAYLSVNEIKRTCHLNQPSQIIMKSATEKLSLSNRTYFKILKIARTIADLENKAEIQTNHIAEALCYRNF